MKKFLSLLITLLLVVGLSSCNNDGPLSARTAKKAVEREAFFARDSQVARLDTGFYEVTRDQLQQLAQLKAAGVITYTAEGVVQKVSERSWVNDYVYRYGYRMSNGGHYEYVTRDVPHVFVKVKLTDQGQRYVVENPTEYRKDYSDFYNHNQEYVAETPEYMSASDATFDNIPGIRANSGTPAVDSPQNNADNIPEETVAEAPAHNDNPNARYERLLSLVNSSSLNVLLGRYKVVEAKDILCTEDMFKAGKAQCTIIYTFADETPFGFVLSDRRQNYYLIQQCEFRLYQDLGWTMVRAD